MLLAGSGRVLRARIIPAGLVSGHAAQERAVKFADVRPAKMDAEMLEHPRGGGPEMTGSAGQRLVRRRGE